MSRLALITFTSAFAFSSFASAAPPTIRVRVDDTLHRVERKGRKLVSRAKKDLKPFRGDARSRPHRLVPRPAGGVWVVTNRSIVRVLPSLEAKAVYSAAEGKKLGDANLAGSNWVIATAGGIEVRDASFALLSTLPLVKSPHKEVHHIATSDGIGYLLDNLMVPVFVFRADLGAPRAPKVLQRINLSGVNVHLSGQWVVPGKGGHWAILRDYSTLYGYGQSIELYGLDGAARGSQQLLSFDRRAGKLKGKGHDRRIHAVLPEGDWALTTRHGGGALELCRLFAAEKRDLRVTFRKCAKLARGVSWASRGHLARQGRWLAAAAEKTVYLVDVRKKPRVVATMKVKGDVVGLAVTKGR